MKKKHVLETIVFLFAVVSAFVLWNIIVSAIKPEVDIQVYTAVMSDSTEAHVASRGYEKFLPLIYVGYWMAFLFIAVSWGKSLVTRVVKTISANGNPQ